MFVILLMSSGPFSPRTTKAFAESPPKDIWTHFSSFRRRCQSNGHCFVVSTSIWSAPAFESQNFKSSAKSRHGLKENLGCVSRNSQAGPFAKQQACQHEDSTKISSKIALNWVLEGAWATVRGRLSHVPITRNNIKNLPNKSVRSEREILAVSLPYVSQVDGEKLVG
ncbi:hypothetical protein CSKR_101038 [Clonorchis sinensis]|uniref:Uncharacterized protein n=1 Tax=Clonorchis sinensis TaxID=79923 RepID=A0A3R7CM36_CLOSI|nr:hypothetical protein CSKR_101038 [Clonorchis sinensis]